MTSKEKYWYRKSNKMCTRCGSPDLEEGKTLCPRCKEYFDKRRHDCIENGVCPICGKRKIYLNEKACYKCNEDRLKRNRRNRKNNRIEYRKYTNERSKRLTIERKEKGLCTRCGKRRATVGFSTCERCRLKSTEYSRAFR